MDRSGVRAPSVGAQRWAGRRAAPDPVRPAAPAAAAAADAVVVAAADTPPPGGPFRLHGGWRRRSGVGATGSFAIWGESPVERFWLEEIPPAPSDRPHPSQMRLEEVAARLAGTPLGLGIPSAHRLPASKAVVPFPVVGSRPLPAVAAPPIPDGRKRPRRVAPWIVQVLPIDLVTAVSSLGSATPQLPEGCEAGPDIEYWARASRLVLSLLARQRFAPRLEISPRGARARWVPVLDDPADALRIAALAASIPRGSLGFGGADGEGMAAEGGGAGGGGGRGGEALLDEFLREAVDACVRRWAGGAGGEPSGGPPAPTGPGLAAWWRGLTGPAGAVELAPAQAEHLDHALRAWLRPLAGATSPSPLRTCLRLEEPHPPEGWPAGTPWSPDPRARVWTLTYLLQPLHDPSLLVPAAEIWGGEGGEGAALLRRQGGRPEEKLLTDLARIAPLWPPLAEGLHRPAPSGLSLRTDEAFAFLAEVAPLLEESAIGVYVPAWWKNPGQRLGVRLRLRRGGFDSAGGGRFGAGTLAVFDWRLALGEDPLTPDEMAALARAKGGLVCLRGTWITADPERLAATAKRWARRGGAASWLDALRWSEGVEGEGRELPVLGVEAEAGVQEMLDRLRSPRTIVPLATPAGFVGTLRPYQLRGLAWLHFLRELGLGGCLADDMGLGKTVQVLALLAHGAGEGNRPGPTLLVCPTSVLGNWQREAARFTPDLSVVLHHGADRARGPALAKAAAGSDLFLTSYALLLRDQDELTRIPWGSFILDEAQAVKNPSAKQSQVARRIAAPWRAILTGTPVENRLRDLWSLFAIANPGYLGPLGDFEERFAGPIEDRGDPAAAARLQALLRPFLLRRLKSDPEIAPELPAKIEVQEHCSLTQEQASLYQAQVDRMMEDLAGADAEVARAASRGGGELARARFGRSGLVLQTLLRLKQVCDHPALMLGDDSHLHGRSGKLSRLVELLQEITGSGGRALVFTQFASFAERLQPYLEDRLGTEVLLLRGATPRPRREELVRRFQDPESPARVFLLSLRAGGVGVNLTAARHVIHFDRWWNPAVEDQATDRAHRIGQNQTVEVRTLVTSGTLEETIDQALREKRALARAVIGGGEQWLAELSTGQLRELVRLRNTLVEE